MAIALFLWSIFIIAYKDSMGQPEPSGTYHFPEESDPHEGTWLIWPHPYEYGQNYEVSLDSIWIKMTKALVESENVHIVAYNKSEEERIKVLLYDAYISLQYIDFYIIPTNDIWARDTGPIYVKDQDGYIVIENWGFNGWGGKYKFNLDNTVPLEVSKYQKTAYINLTKSVILEGGSAEIDGSGTFMATKSSTLNKNRNPGMTVEQFESIVRKYYGVTNFIWLDGVPGLDVTDMHIDGFVKFLNSSHLLTMNQSDLINSWKVPQSDVKKLQTAKNAKGVPYKVVEIPLTKNNVTLSNGTKLTYQGSYINYYIANTRVLVPNYNDINDAAANNLIQTFYPGRVVVGIDVRELYKEGGMIHCVTQQQPKGELKRNSAVKISVSLFSMLSFTKIVFAFFIFHMI